MQTFLPYEDFARSAEVLDMKRLGKQRVETMQVVLGILRVNLDGTPKTSKRTWGDHVIGKMWRQHLPSLMEYQRAICLEWSSRGYRDTCLVKTETALISAGIDLEHVTPPPWLGSQRVHESHQSNLVRKFPEHYGPLFPGVGPDLPYFWPTDESVDHPSDSS